jgi:hypothetical protein
MLPGVSLIAVAHRDTAILLQCAIDGRGLRLQDPFFFNGALLLCQASLASSE